MTWMACSICLERESVGNDRPGIELTAAQESAHLVPGLVHLPAGDTIEGQAFEDHVAREIHFGGSAGRTEEVDSSAESRGGKCLGVTARVAAHLADQVDAISAGELEDPGEHIIAAGIQRDVGAHRAGQFEPAGVEVAGDDERRTGGAGDAHRKAADRAAAEHEDGAAGDRGFENGVDGVAHRIHDRADFGGDSIELHHVRCGHRDVVGKRAVAVDADDPGALAEMGRAQAALETVPADDVAFRGYRVSNGEQLFALGLPAELDDLSGKLMADHHRGLEAGRWPRRPIPRCEDRCRRRRHVVRGSVHRWDHRREWDGP